MSNAPVLAAQADCALAAAADPATSATSATPATSPTPARRPSLADRVARSFPPLACVRGFGYFARGRVELSSVTESAADAVVKGKRTQQVRLRIDAGRLAAACTCAAKVLGPATCRHVWATLLEIDRQGAFASLRGTQRVLALDAIDTPRPKRDDPAHPAGTPRSAKRSKRSAPSPAPAD